MDIPSLPDENRGPALLVVTWVFAAISSGLTILRLHCRVNLLKAAGADDIVLLIGVVCVSCVSVEKELIEKMVAHEHYRFNLLFYISWSR